MNRKDIDDLKIYQLGMDVGELIYELVFKWDRLNRNTIGYQLIRAADSISANISEGYGRFHFKEQRQYCYIARGSLYETSTWLTKASHRIPNDKNEIERLLEMLHSLLKQLNSFINYINIKIKS
jgi:four helix bundle protein